VDREEQRLKDVRQKLKAERATILEAVTRMAQAEVKFHARIRTFEDFAQVCQSISDIFGSFVLKRKVAL
jgi:hypothetical protein